jgi:hypothetical protein
MSTPLLVRLCASLAVATTLLALGVWHLAQGTPAIGLFLPLPMLLLLSATSRARWEDDSLPLVAGWSGAGALVGAAVQLSTPLGAGLPVLDMGTTAGFLVAVVTHRAAYPSLWTWPLWIFGRPLDLERFMRLALADVLEALPHLMDPAHRLYDAEQPHWGMVRHANARKGTPTEPNPLGPWGLLVHMPDYGRALQARWVGLPFRLSVAQDDEAIAQSILDRHIAQQGARGLTNNLDRTFSGWHQVTLMPPSVDASAHARMAWMAGLRT